MLEVGAGGVARHPAERVHGRAGELELLMRGGEGKRVVSL